MIFDSGFHRFTIENNLPFNVRDRQVHLQRKNEPLRMFGAYYGR